MRKLLCVLAAFAVNVPVFAETESEKKVRESINGKQFFSRINHVQDRPFLPDVGVEYLLDAGVITVESASIEEVNPDPLFGGQRVLKLRGKLTGRMAEKHWRAGSYDLKNVGDVARRFEATIPVGGETKIESFRCVEGPADDNTKAWDLLRGGAEGHIVEAIKKLRN